MSVQQEKFKAIADRIRRYLGNDDLIKPNDFADKVDEAVNNQALIAYNSGKSDGIEQQQPIIDGYLADFAEIKETVNNTGAIFIEDDTPTSDYAEKINERCLVDFSMGESKGLSEGIEQGKQSAYDEFWDSYQNNGSRTNYDKKFLGTVWNDTTFNPRHNIVPTSASEMFRLSNVVDLRAIMSTGKLRFTSNCGGCYGIFRECSNLEYVGDIVVSGAGNYSYLFYGCSKLKSVGTITDWNRGAGNAFYNCTSLTEIRYSGSIGQSLDMRSCPLNKASIESIINCLSGTATGQTLTLKATAVASAFESSEGAADGCESSEWLELVGSKPNWTIIAGTYTWNS